VFSRGIIVFFAPATTLEPDTPATVPAAVAVERNIACCEKVGLKKGRWTKEEDEILARYIMEHGEGSWTSLPKNAGTEGTTDSKDSSCKVEVSLSGWF
jgi:hypothetical protein